MNTLHVYCGYRKRLNTATILLMYSHVLIGAFVHCSTQLSNNVLGSAVYYQMRSKRRIDNRFKIKEVVISESMHYMHYKKNKKMHKKKILHTLVTVHWTDSDLTHSSGHMMPLGCI